MSHQHRRHHNDKRCCNNRNGYPCNNDCTVPYFELPYEEKCNKYSLPDCGGGCCSSSSECSDELSRLADDIKFPTSFEPYLHRECTRDCDSCSSSSEDCCPKPDKIRRYKPGGKRHHRRSSSSSSDDHHKDDCSSSSDDHHKGKHHHKGKGGKKGWISVCSDKSSSDNKRRAREFLVTTAPKNKHPQAHRIPEGAKVWAINGAVGPRINLREGTTYYFKVSQPDTEQAQDFFLTTDIAGGRDFADLQLKGTTVLSNGTLVLKVDSMTPRYFYYQSKQGLFRGGPILVI